MVRLYGKCFPFNNGRRKGARIFWVTVETTINKQRGNVIRFICVYIYIYNIWKGGKTFEHWADSSNVEKEQYY